MRPPLRVVAHAFVYETLHALDEFGGGEAGLRLGVATELSVNHRAHAIEHAPQQPLDQRLVALLLFLFTHKSGRQQQSLRRALLRAGRPEVLERENGETFKAFYSAGILSEKQRRGKSRKKLQEKRTN